VRLNTEAHAAQPTIEFTAPEESAITSLAVIETTSAALVYAPGALTALVDRLKQEVRAQLATLDVSIPSQRSRIISLSARVATAKVKLDKLGDSLIEEHRAVVTAVNSDRKAMRDDLDAFKVEVRKPVTDLENAETARKAAHEAALILIADTVIQDHPLSLGEIESRIALANQLYDRDWQEFKQRAAGAKALAMECLGRAHDREFARLADIAEAERIASEAHERAIKEREEAAAKAAQEAAERRAAEQARIAREAAERERQRIENERIEAEARAKQAEAERIAAEERAARELREAEERRIREAEYAEQKRLAAEKEATRQLQLAAERAVEAAAQAVRDQAAAIEVERQRVAAQHKAELEEAEKRAKNRAHQGAIHREILAALALLNISEEAGKLLIASIAKGVVPHVTISY
jgi:hypothetical protein